MNIHDSRKIFLNKRYIIPNDKNIYYFASGGNLFIFKEDGGQLSTRYTIYQEGSDCFIKSPAFYGNQPLLVDKNKKSLIKLTPKNPKDEHDFIYLQLYAIFGMSFS